MEEYGFVLDYLPEGRPTAPIKRMMEPLAYIIGKDEYRLFEVSVKKDVEIGEMTYIGKNTEKREKVNRILRRISYDDLTGSAKSDLPNVLEKIVMERERFFVNFFNNAGPITTRFHMLELLPGLGKKIMWSILEQRDKARFKSFEDIVERAGLKNPQRLIVKRIEVELSNREEKYALFVKNEGFRSQ